MQAGIQAGVEVVFQQLFDDYHQPIFSYIYRLVGEAERAEELTQDVFVKAYGAIGRLPVDANRRAWLYRIATNTAYDQLRRARLLRWLPFRESDAPRGEDEPPDGATGMDVQPGSENRGLESASAEHEAVQHALKQLAPDYRAPLVLFCVQGYSTREISEMLGVSEGAVKTRLCRAREKFRLAFGEGY